jgi:hypothetical protein
MTDVTCPKCRRVMTADHRHCPWCYTDLLPLLGRDPLAPLSVHQTPPQPF